MNNQDAKQLVHGLPRPARPALDTVAGRGLLTWWDLMSDLDPGWLAWSEELQEPDESARRVA